MAVQNDKNEWKSEFQFYGRYARQNIYENVFLYWLQMQKLDNWSVSRV